MKAGIVAFPGINRERDIAIALQRSSGHKPRMLWHKNTDLGALDLVVIPGGFSYGDYLRCGAMAAQSPIMAAIRAHADRGGHVLGVCNGFQVLCESHLLPGALVRNEGQRFLCKQIHMRTENSATPFTNKLAPGQVLEMPIAHGEGRYVCDDDTLDDLFSENRVLFRYCDAEGNLTPESNPNGSRDAIAGIASANFNVLGLMPHPERACDLRLGSADGKAVFESLLAFWK